MKIESIDIYKLNIGLTTPLRMPLGVISSAENIALRINTDSDVSGWGEASPFHPITGDTQEACYALAPLVAKTLVGKDPVSVEVRMREVRHLTFGHGSLASAFDVALHDICAKVAGMPLYQYLGGEYRELSTDVSVGILPTVEETVNFVTRVKNAGFNAVKLKVGRPGREDVAHIRAARKAIGGSMGLRIDANQGWDYLTAESILSDIQDLDIEYCEQPLPESDTVGAQRLRNNVKVPIAADESLRTVSDAFALTAGACADFLNIKLGKSGGICSAKKINAVAESAGVRSMIGCFAASRLSLTVDAHFAVAHQNIAFCNLDSAYFLETDPVLGGAKFDFQDGGTIRVPNSSGHGADFNLADLDDSTHIHVS